VSENAETAQYVPYRPFQGGLERSDAAGFVVSFPCGHVLRLAHGVAIFTWRRRTLRVAFARVILYYSVASFVLNELSALAA
jgi:hypothetical protein